MASPYDSVISAILGGTPPPSSDVGNSMGQLLTKIADRLKTLIEIPVPAHPFLVPDTATPAAGQLTESAFIGLALGQAITAVGTPGISVTAMAKASVAIFDRLASLGNTEILTRMMLELEDGGTYDATEVAGRLADAVATRRAGWTDAFTRDLDATVWNDEEAGPTLPTLADAGHGAVHLAANSGAGVATAALAAPSTINGALLQMAMAAAGPAPRISGSVPSSPDLGNRVHRFLQETYANEHPTHFVVIEQGVRISAGQPPHWDRLVDIIGTLPGDQPAKAGIYVTAIRNPVTGAQWKADIADLENAPPLPQLLAEWGWFEIKPWRQTIEGFYQLSMYLAFWDAGVLLTHPTKWQEWKGLPGCWMPPLIMTPVDADRLVVIVRIFPGVIIYYVFQLEKHILAEKTFIAIQAALASLLARAILRRIGKLQRPILDGLAWALTIAIALVAVIEALEAAAAAGIGASLAYAATAIAAWLGQRLATVPGW